MINKASNVKIVFICSGLEPGRDGVGDYTRKLAAAMIKLGDICAIVSLNDRGISENVTDKQQVDGIDVPVTRIPSTWPDKERYATLKVIVKAFNPDWVSLQFVPFGFHEKGLKHGLSKLLLSINSSAKWHVMIHELWVGMDKQSTIKFKAWGWLQKQMITSLLGNLKPAVVTTQAVLYKSHLAGMGYDAVQLPLFSNISKTALRPLAATGSSKTITFVIFGNIHYGAPIKDFSQEVAAYGQEQGITFILKLLGHCGASQNDWINDWQLAGLKADALGEQSAEIISSQLLNADIGITTTPFTITDKSGSFAAMREHGLPVISVSRTWHPALIKNINAPDGVFYYQKGNFKEFYSKPEAMPATYLGIDAVSAQLSDLLRGI